MDSKTGGETSCPVTASRSVPRKGPALPLVVTLSPMAATTLRVGGAFAALVPSMEALECDVFGGAYRSLRHDHLHLFSRRSLARCMEAAGLRVVAVESQCAVHVLRAFLTDDALAALYASGRGPDLLGVGVRDAP